MSNPRNVTSDTTKETPELPAGWRVRALIPFESLRNHDFRYLWFGQLGQASSMWAEQIARSWLTWQLTGSATAIGLVNVFRALPLITLGLVGGVVADRFDKKKVLIVIQLWSLAIYIAMAVLILGGWIELWHVYLTAFLLGGGMALNQPVRTSFIPQLLDGKLLVNALSLNSIAINVTRLAGPAAIGFLIAFADDSVGPAYVVASVVYLLVLASTFKIRTSGVIASDRPTSMVRDFLDGFRYMLLENRLVLALVVMAMGPLAFAFSYMVLLPVFVTDELGMGPSAFGSLQSIAAVGALAGGLTLASMGRVPYKGPIMIVSGMAYGILLVLMGGIPLPIIAFALVIFIGASQTIFRAVNNSTLLQITPRHLQGRVISITFLDMGIQSAAALAAGAVTDAYGVSLGLIFLGLICVAIVGAIGLGVPAVRRL